MEYERKLPTTGYWIFICNTKIWNPDEWFAHGETELFYRISDHHQGDMTAGQMGLLRVNNDLRSKALRKGRPKLAAGIYAIFEVLGTGCFIKDDDRRANNLPDDGEPRWRVRVKVLKNLFARPVLLEALPDDQSFQYFRKPLRTSTIPLSRAAFEKVLSLADSLELLQHRDAPATDAVLAESLAGIRELENRLFDATPKQQHAIGVRIERGSVGAAVKRLRKGCCQICAALGRDGVAFNTRRGQLFAEAHHVIPVSALRSGSLSHVNIMVLCPNHHRQAHYGAIDVVANEPRHWRIVVDGVAMEIDKLTLDETARSLPKRQLTM